MLRCTALHLQRTYIAENATLAPTSAPPQSSAFSKLKSASSKSFKDSQSDETRLRDARCIPAEIRKKINGEIDVENFSTSMFDMAQRKCFTTIFDHIFVPFVSSDAYSSVMKATRQKHVAATDFEYFEWLGRGGYGVVIHVRKRSTGKHYALKIQPKRALLETYFDDFTRLDSERTVFAAAQHPFIVSMDYAFQSDGLVFLALKLATAGTLSQALRMKMKHDGRGLPERSVRFYTAEICMALEHLHELGIMYRDLKPSNVLLHKDGHCYLADMGAVCEFGGNLFKTQSAKTAQRLAPAAPTQRRHSVMGTPGYAASPFLTRSVVFRLRAQPRAAALAHRIPLPTVPGTEPRNCAGTSRPRLHVCCSPATSQVRARATPRPSISGRWA